VAGGGIMGVNSGGRPGSDHTALLHAWEDVKAMFNGGNRRRVHCQVEIVYFSDEDS